MTPASDTGSTTSGPTPPGAEPTRPAPGTYVDAGVGTAPTDHLQRLWAPYRSAYLADDARTHGDNPFTTLPQRSDEDALIIARGEQVYCLLNLFPYNPGHMMVVPYREIACITELTEAESRELMDFTQTAIRVLRSVSRPDAINVGFNLGRESGGSIGRHLHQHIVPRWAGDANFMTVLSGTKVLPQTLRETRALLAEAWARTTAAQ